MIKCDACGKECLAEEYVETIYSEFWGQEQVSEEIYLLSDCCGDTYTEIDEEEE